MVGGRAKPSSKLMQAHRTVPHRTAPSYFLAAAQILLEKAVTIHGLVDLWGIEFNARGSSE